MAKPRLGILGGSAEHPRPAGLDKIDIETDPGNIRQTGVGLREKEIQALDYIGELLGEKLDAQPVARNALIRHAVRRLIAQVQSGELQLADLAALFDAPGKPRARYKG